MKSRKINYLTRPSKYIERKIFVEVLQRLNRVGYNVSDYHYIGFGGYYYADFVLFSRYLSITKMTCLENDKDIKKRMEFNKPYNFIDLKIEDCSQFVARIDKNKKYFVWLDFESKPDKDIITNIKLITHSLKNGSILIITVNADAKEIKNIEYVPEKDTKAIQSKMIKGLYKKSVDDLSPFCGQIKKKDVAPSMLPVLYSKTINSVIRNGLIGRSKSASFYQLFNYVYQDGTRMLTFGGVIDEEGKESEIKKILKGIKYINYAEDPLKINIPPLTIREKLYLDQNIQKNRKTIKGGLPFELTKEELSDYIRFAKHYPTFYEVITN